MRKKFLMFLMCFTVLGTTLTGCGTAADVPVEVEEEEDTSDADKDSEDDEDEDEDRDNEDDDKDPVVPDDNGDDTEEENGIPRSDAYDMFLAGEMKVNVIPDMTDEYYEYNYPKAGEYSYDELVDYVLGEYPGTFDVKYSLFTPSTGREGDDVMALYLENRDPVYYNWLGLIAYNNGELQLKYCTTFGYRSYFDLYFTGDILSGGSGGAGAQYQDYMQVMPDSSVVTVYKASFLYSTWCNEISYYLAPDMEYEDRPSLDVDSDFQITSVNKDGKVYICTEALSDNKSVRAEEEKFVGELVDLGAILMDPEFIHGMMNTGIDEGATMNWFDIETVESEYEP